MKALLSLLLFISCICSGQTTKTLQNDREFSWRIFGNMANYFENERDLLDFFEFKKGNVVAEVGAGKWENVVGLSLLTDSITFYAQDIDAKNLQDKDLEKALSKTEKYKWTRYNTFKSQIGTEKESLLSDNSFDKIILSSTFHEFTYMNEMISDLYKKLKSNGKIYILESKCGNKDHKNYTAVQTEEILKKHGFTLLAKDGKNINGATGIYRMAFVKN